MGEWRDGVWVWSLELRRTLLDREASRLEGLYNRVGSFNPREGQRDRWSWIKESSGVFSVRSAYRWIQGETEEEDEEVFSLLWRVKAPSNPTTLAWKMILNRI